MAILIPQTDQPLVERIEDKRGFISSTWFRFLNGLTSLSNLSGQIDLTTQVVNVLPLANGGSGNKTNTINLQTQVSNILLKQNGGTGSGGVSIPWTPTDGSGAGLVFTVTHAAYTIIAGVVVLQADVTFPVTASGANAQFNGVPISGVGEHSGSIWNNSATGATSCLLTVNVINFYTASGTPLTNANLSAAIVRIVIVYQTT